MGAIKKERENPVTKMAEAMGNMPVSETDGESAALKELMAQEQPKAFEIMPGMTVEEMQCIFFDKNALIEPRYKVWQLNSKGHRYYYRYNENDEPEFYPSVTTILAQTLPQSPWLTKWIADKGFEEAERYKNERAAYGTFMHSQFEELLLWRSYNLDELKERLQAYIDREHLPSDFIYYADDLKKDILAFAQFILDYNVRPLAVEIALVHPYYNYAGMIDMPCRMWDKQYGGNDITAIVDFKSGRKGFYEEHELQLGMYRDLWNVNFEHLPIERIYNFSPKDWRKKPTYNLKDQTNSPNLKKIPYLLQLAAIEDEKIENIFTSVNGVIALDNAPDLTENIISLSLAELVKTRMPKEETPGEDVAVTVEDVSEKSEPVSKPVKRQTTAKKEASKVAKTTTKRKTTLKKEEKPVKATKTSKRVTVPKVEEKPGKALKSTKTAAKRNLLSEEPEI